MSQRATFLKNLNKHKFKFLFLTSAISFPLYKHQVYNLYDNVRFWTTKKALESLEKENEPISHLTQAFLKKVVLSSLQDREIQNASIDFVNKIVQKREIKESVIDLLLKAIKDPYFLKNIKNVGTDLGKSIVSDAEVQRDAVKLIVNALNDEEVKFEVTELLKEIVAKDDVSQAFSKLVSKSFSNKEVQDGMTLMLEESFNKIMVHPETIDKVKIFGYNLMNTEIDTNTASVSFLDVVLRKVISKGSQEKINNIEHLLYKEKDEKNSGQDLKKENTIDEELLEWDENLKSFESEFEEESNKNFEQKFNEELDELN